MTVAEKYYACHEMMIVHEPESIKVQIHPFFSNSRTEGLKV